MDIQEALGRIEQGFGGVEEAAVVRGLLGELRTLAVGAQNALADRDVMRAAVWVERVVRMLSDDYAGVQGRGRPSPQPSPAKCAGEGEEEDGRCGS